MERVITLPENCTKVNIFSLRSISINSIIIITPCINATLSRAHTPHTLHHAEMRAAAPCNMHVLLTTFLHIQPSAHVQELWSFCVSVIKLTATYFVSPKCGFMRFLTAFQMHVLYYGWISLKTLRSPVLVSFADAKLLDF